MLSGQRDYLHGERARALERVPALDALGHEAAVVGGEESGFLGEWGGGRLRRSLLSVPGCGQRA